MNLKRLPVMIIFLMFCGGYLTAQQENIVKQELIIQFRPQTDLERWVGQMNSMHNESFNLKAERLLSERMNIWLFSYDLISLSEKEMLGRVNRSSFVETAQFNHIVQLRTEPNDTNFHVQWNLHNTVNNTGQPDADIDAVEAWNITTGGYTAQGDTIVVAVIDNGIDLQHEDMMDNLWKNYAEIPGNGIDDDSNGFVDDYNGWDFYKNNDSLIHGFHGTPVASIIGARGNNKLGISGVNWEIKILPVAAAVDEASVIASYDYVLNFRIKYNETDGKEGAFVVATNSSWGIDFGQPGDAPLWCAMYDTLGKHGILSAGATINADQNVDSVGDLPTACPSDYLISVTNTRSDDTKEKSAGYGLMHIDLGAPGTGVYAAFPFNSYYTFGGTSSAAPHVTGAIALLYATTCPDLITDAKLYPDSVAKQIKRMILDGVDSLPGLAGMTVSGGRLNLMNSLLFAEDYSGCQLSSVEHGLDADADQEGILNLYPNPANRYIHINYNNLKTGNNQFIICNMQGQKVLHFTDEIRSPGLHSKTINISDLAPGIYFIYIASGYKQSGMHKFVVY